MASMKNNHHLVLPLFLAFLWANFVSLSQATSISISPSYVASMPCLKVLIPCQFYLNPTLTPPPPSCCVSIKEVASNDVNCLCDIFNSDSIFFSLNITRDDALKLPKACGTDVDVSVCKRDAKTSSPSKPGNPSATSSTTSSSDSATMISPANRGLFYIAGSSFAAGFLSLIISLF